jgi:hypothetical protein
VQAYDQWEAEEAAAAQRLVSQQRKHKANVGGKGKKGAAAAGKKGGKKANPWSDGEADSDAGDMDLDDDDDAYVVGVVGCASVCLCVYKGGLAAVLLWSIEAGYGTYNPWRKSGCRHA